MQGSWIFKCGGQTSHEAGKRSILFKSHAKELRMEERTLLNNNFIFYRVKINMFRLVPHTGDLDQDLCGMLSNSYPGFALTKDKPPSKSF